jgi:hypothetical protein
MDFRRQGNAFVYRVYLTRVKTCNDNTAVKEGRKEGIRDERN